MKNCFVKLVLPSDVYNRKALISSLSFIQPMKRLTEPGEILLFDCNNEEELDNRLNYLCEASSVDFSYQYKFID